MPGEQVVTAQEVKEYGQQVAAYFIGPKSANLARMESLFKDIIVEDLRLARNAYQHTDEPFITEETTLSDPFKVSMTKLENVLKPLSKYMGQHSIPFYSPRYMAHMACEPCLPALLGYMLTMFYNPNNVAAEASPVTTMMEYHLGQDLCEMLGYRRRPLPGASKVKKTKDNIAGWGHITPGGSISNLEAMWAARNLKFYALALRNAMAVEDGPLEFAYSSFKVELCTGEIKLFSECTTWELLNLNSYTILSLAEKLAIDFRLSSSYVDLVMNDFIIQSTGMDSLQKQYGIGKPPVILISHTNHYSWPKAAAILGIGRDNLIEIPVDEDARLDIEKLEEVLIECIKDERAVYQVVAIIGSTEIGSVDPVEKILNLRKKYEKKGLSFSIHADGAWGGYFTSILRVDPHDLTSSGSALALSTHTLNELTHLKDVDSITLDPHKSGYCPYPGGALCYRDERMRFLVTWTSPYLGGKPNGLESIGTFGVAGSTPGAAPVSAWIAASVIGLHKKGYGALLSTALFTAARLWCHWATMETDKFFTVTFNRLPSEKQGGGPDAVKAEKDFIRGRILLKSNAELFGDQPALEKLRLLGSDLMINAYATNFKINGKTNPDILEANYLNRRIYNDLSVSQVADDINKKKIFIMATSLSQKSYGQALKTFKTRLGLYDSEDDLYVLVNVSMSPFPAEGSFIDTMAKAFEDKAEEIAAEVIKRTIPRMTRHSFVVQGTDQLYFTYVANFHTWQSRYQTIFTGDVPSNVLERYKSLRAESPDSVFTLHTAARGYLGKTMLGKKTFMAVIDRGVPIVIGMDMGDGSNHSIPAFPLTNIRIIKERRLDSRDLDLDYPKVMPFYLYGSLGGELHIDHVIHKAPNFRLSSSNVKLELKPEYQGETLADELKKGAIMHMVDVHERAMQPFTRDNEYEIFTASTNDRGTAFRIEVYTDSDSPELLATGLVILGTAVYKDYDYLNKDPMASRSTLDQVMPDEEEFSAFLSSRKDTPWVPNPQEEV